MTDASYDQGQSPRLGQTQPPENPGIRMVTFDELPEVAYQGQIVYLTDLGYILIYDGSAWQSVGNASVGTGAKIYVGDTDPSIANSINDGDIWYESTPKVLHVWQSGAWQLASVADGSITTTKIANLAVTTAKIADLAVTNAKINNLSVSKLLVTNLTNLIEDGTFEGAQLNWSGAGTVTSGVTGPLGTTTNVLQMSSTGSNVTRSYIPGSQMSAHPGEVYYLESWVRKTTTGTTGSVVLWLNANLNNAAQVALTAQAMSLSAMTQNTWYNISGQVTIPAGKNQMIPAIQIGSTVPSGQTIQWDNVVMHKAMDGDLVVDGTITASKITGTAIDGKTITAPIIQTSTGLGSGDDGMQISADTAGGVIKFWTGDFQETGAGWVNPVVDLPSVFDGIAQPMLELASPATSSGRSRIQLMSDGVFMGKPLWLQNGMIAYDDDITIAPSHGGSGTPSLTLTNPPTSTSAVNARIGPAGRLEQVTSLSKNKLDQKVITVEQAEKLLKLTPKTWLDRYDVEIHGEENVARTPGFVAEDVAEHAPDFAVYLDGELSSVAYDRIPAALLVLIKEQQKQIVDLRKRLDALETM